MNTLEINKIVGAVLVAALSMTLISQIGNILVPSGGHGDAHQEGAASTQAARAPAPVVKPLSVLLQTADAKEGEKTARACIACHTFEKGGPNKIGPDLWGIVGRPKASHEGFAYSDALKSLGGEWTYEDIFEFIANPSAMARGTKMSFRLGNAEKRADIIAYLRTLSDNPVPLPEPTPEELKEAEEKPDEAEGAAATKPEAAEPAQEAKQAEPEKPAAELIAAASPEAGEKVAKKCVSCHDLSKGGKNKVGPHLWGVVGRDKASISDYSYSAGMKALEGNWTYEDLYKYLANPAAVAKGSKMTFKLTKSDERAAIIAYLRTLNDNPPPLPGN